MIKLFKLLSLSSLMLSTQAVLAMNDSELAQAMNQDIAKYMSVVKAPKLLFHWVDASDINPKGEYNKRYEATAAHYTEYVTKQGRRIYNNRRSGDSDIEGPGLYMASDPLVSRSYGGQRSYGLIVGVLRVGAKVLTGSGVNLSIAPHIKNEISKRGCVAYSYESILDTFDKTCAKIKKLLVAKDASFANGRIYSWGSNHVTGCSQRRLERDIKFPAAMSSYSEPETFVVYNSELFSKIYGFTSLSQEILSYLKGLELTSGKEILPDLQMDNPAILAKSAGQVSKFSLDKILGCVE